MTENNHGEPKPEPYPYKRFFTCLEVSFVVAVSVIVVFGLGFLVFASGDPATTKAGQILKLLNDNWKALLLLMIPLFYYPVRDFLGRLKKIAGLEAEGKLPDEPAKKSPMKGEG